MATYTQQVLKGVKTALNNNTFVKSGYVFLGWNTDKTAASPIYSDGGEYTFDQDKTLYAIWQKTAQYYTIVGAFGFSTYINGYNSDKQKAVQRIANQDIEWTDMADTSMISVTDFGYAPGGKFIRTVYSYSNNVRPEYSADGITWTQSSTKMAKQAFCCGGVYNGSPRYIVVCDPTTPGEVPGDYVGPWWSDDAITWTRSKLLNSLGSIQNYYTNYDLFEDCFYGRISVSGEEKDVFLV